MKILVAIPSKNRVDILKENTLSWVKYIDVDWMVFVEPQDLMNYRLTVGTKNCIPLDENNKGLGYSKTIIKNYAEKYDYDLVFKLDDDVKGWTEFRKILKGKEAAERFNKNLEDIVEIFEQQPQVAVVSFPYSFQMFEQFLFKKNKRVQTCYITRIEDFHTDPRISVFEDFSVGLKAIVSQKLVLWYGMSGIAMGVKVGGGTGGHQDFDRKERALKEIEVLREIYPPLAFREVNKIWCYEPDLKSLKIGLYL